MALGAERTDVLRWVLVQGMRPAVVGMAAGLLVALGVAAAMRNLLFEVAPTDPLALSLVSSVLLLTAAVACYLPARRAAALDPADALRTR